MSDFGSRSFWLEDAYTPGAALEGDRSVDVAIIGGGFTGLWTAYFLKRAEPALRIALLEQEVVGYGASDGIGAFTREHRVECHYEKNGLLCVASDPSQIPRVEAEYHDAERLGLTGFRFLDRAAVQASVHSPTYECGVREESCAIVNPARLVR